MVGNQVVIDNSLISIDGVGTYQMRLAVTPLFKPSPHYEYFEIDVKLCEVDSITVANPVPDTYYYQIDNPANTLEVPLPFISATPACTNGYLGLGLDYKL